MSPRVGCTVCNLSARDILTVVATVAGTLAAVAGAITLLTYRITRLESKVDSMDTCLRSIDNRLQISGKTCSQSNRTPSALDF